MYDLSTSDVTEYGADGTPGDSAAFDWYSGYFGNQTASGLWTGVEGATGGQLIARVSIALDFAVDSYVQRNVGTQQKGPLPRPGRGTDQDKTAMLLMDHLLVVPPQTDASGQRIEHSGHICREPDMQHFYYLDLPKGTALNSQGLVLSPERCKNATTVGFAHSHPGTFNNFDLPSGFSSQSEYYDVTPTTAPSGGCQQNPSVQNAAITGCDRSDLWIADYYFDDPAWGPKGPNVMWYVTAPFVPNTYVKYKKTATDPAKDNIWRYQPANGQWGRVPAPW